MISRTKQCHKMYVKAKIVKTLQNSKCRLCGYRNETINRECSKLVQKEHKTRHDWVSKKFKLDLSNKWSIHNPESIRENETYKVLWDFEIQTDHRILASRQDLVILNKRKKSELYRSTDYQVKLKESEKRDWTLYLSLIGIILR